MARRAVAAEEKEARRAVILAAARELFTASEGVLPTAAEIAAATGLAKGTVYLYFQTKEEIFASLLLQGWSPVMEMVERVFAVSKGRRAEKVKAFITTLAAHLERHPELLRLDALNSGVLEKNMTAEALHTFKREFTALLVHAGASIDRSLQLANGRGVQVLMRSYALTRGLWQSAQHGQGAAAAGVDAALVLTPDAYLQELKEALTEYWRGALR